MRVDFSCCDNCAKGEITRDEMSDEDSKMREAYHSEFASTAKTISSTLNATPHTLPAALVDIVCSYVVSEPVLVHGFGFVTNQSIDNLYMFPPNYGDPPRLFVGYGSFVGYLKRPLRPDSSDSSAAAGGGGGGGDGESGGGEVGGSGSGDGESDEDHGMDEYGMTGQERHQNQLRVGHTICRVMRRHGLEVEWSGDAGKKIICKGFSSRSGH